MEEIKLKIMPDGEVRIEVTGVKGQQCLELTELLEKELGLEVKHQLTSEFYEVVEETTKVQVKAK